MKFAVRKTLDAADAPAPHNMPMEIEVQRKVNSLTRPIREWSELAGDEIALVSGDRTFTWREWASRIARLAAVLRHDGLHSGDRVAILGQNSHRHMESLYAGMWAGGISVPLNLRLALPELIETARDCEPAILVADAEFQDQAAAVAAAVPSIRAILRESDYEARLASASPVADTGRQDGDVACLVYTGGTTGRPKGVMLSHGNLVANVENAAGVVPFDRNTVHLHCGAMFHLSALWRVFALTQCGGRSVVLPRFDASEVLRAIEQHRVTAAAFVPTMIAALMDSPGFRQERLASLRIVTYGASPVSEALLERMMRALPQCGLYQGYGMSETSPAVTFSRPGDHTPGNPRLRSAGKPLPQVEVRIVDSEDRAVAMGAVGEIQVRGATVMKGYWRQPELTAQALRGGWMRTGDAGRFDADGYLYIVDRLKDMVVTGGENVYCSEVENAIASHPSVAECAVFGIPDEKWGEAVHAVVVAKPGQALSAADVQDHCRLRIAAYKCPKSVELRAEPLPLSAVNKVLKAPLRAKWWAGKARNVA